MMGAVRLAVVHVPRACALGYCLPPLRGLFACDPRRPSGRPRYRIVSESRFPPLEWASLEEMATAVRVNVELLRIWAAATGGAKPARRVKRRAARPRQPRRGGRQ